MTRAKKIWVVLFSVLLAVLAYAVSYLRDVQLIASGYVSQTLCTNVLMLGRDQAEVERYDLSAAQNRITSSVVHADRVVTTARIGPVSNTSTSVFRPGLACSNTGGLAVEEVLAIGIKDAVAQGFVQTDSGNFLTGESPSFLSAKAKTAVRQVVDQAFLESTDDIYQRKNTRAVLVHHKGQLLAERYAEGFDHTSALRGMSMTKSATSALVGILVGKGKLDIESPAPVTSWPDEPGYKEITSDNLLKMTAGFDYNEAYETDPRNLLSTMLMTQADMPAFAAKTPLLGQTGEFWDYQTVHSVLLQEVIRNAIDDDQAYFQFPQKELFDKLGMNNSFFQADAKGTFTGGAFMYASGRDWLRLGLLYLNDGVHVAPDGKRERILPEGWVEYSVTPSKPSLQKRAYGAQIWLNAAGPERLFPKLPEDAYAFQGHYGQYVVVVPSLDLVIVRLGMTFYGEDGEQSFDKKEFVHHVVAALTR